ncbi:molybdenum cofactor guanylyltransferase [Paenibacillus xylanexedens]|uniref:molybdenum cofactor guanylyltransferase n=1 Tax=Paenibacillus xylanexedens TaxID=528191 RepID=UPI0011AA8F6E|nr:molybdenum cofactor guanylyltransferase [Paenibacillus xylanexedens]
MNTTEWTGIILAGGQSRRMGSNKALLPVKGSTLLSQIASSMIPEVARIIVAGGSHVATYAELGYECVQDQYPGKGPLAGLHAALQASDTNWNLVCACDMPLIRPSFFAGMKQLAESSDQHSVIVPRIAGRVHPLAGVYHRRVLTELTQCLDQDRLRVTGWLEEMNPLYIDVQELESVGVLDAVDQLSNVNTPQEYQSIRNHER